MKKLAYYITPHGFGHAVRSLEIIRRLLEVRPDVDITIISDIPDFLILQNVGKELPQRRKRLDAGLVQLDSIRFDLDASRELLHSLYRQRDGLVADELRFLESRCVEGVVSDVSFLALETAFRHGIPGIGISNFTWDWIYSAYARSDPQWDPLVAWIRECYGKCSLFLQLPMHGDSSSCPRIMDVPLVTRKARRKSEETRRVLGLNGEHKAYLVSFAALELDEDAQKRLEKLEHARFFYRRPLKFHFSNGRSLDDADLSYADIVAAMDGVITTPGYGIVADCLASGAPMVYTDRGVFPEVGILVEEMTRQLTTAHMPSADFYSGNWGPALRELESLPRKAPALRTDGADVCVQEILRELGWE